MTRVLIADDDDLMRAGLAELLTVDPEIEVAGQAATGREAVEQARRLTPDVVLMDVRMPDLDGIAATRELARAAPGVRVLILTTFEQDDYVFGALRAGASGFLLKRTRPEELIAAVHTVAGGDSLLSPSVTRRVIDRMAQQPAPDLTGQPQAGGTHAARARGARADCARALQPGDRRTARRREVNGSQPHQAHPVQAWTSRPCPDRDLRLRERHESGRYEVIVAVPGGVAGHSISARMVQAASGSRASVEAAAALGTRSSAAASRAPTAAIAAAPMKAAE